MLRRHGRIVTPPESGQSGDGAPTLYQSICRAISMAGSSVASTGNPGLTGFAASAHVEIHKSPGLAAAINFPISQPHQGRYPSISQKGLPARSYAKRPAALRGKWSRKAKLLCNNNFQNRGKRIVNLQIFMPCIRNIQSTPLSFRRLSRWGLVRRRPYISEAI